MSAAGVVDVAAAVSAAESAGGSSLPRLAARRRIPEQAFALKKNRRGTSPVSKISDNEEATAALWYSGILGIENPPGALIPAFPHEPEEGSKVPSFVGTK